MIERYTSTLVMNVMYISLLWRANHKRWIPACSVSYHAMGWWEETAGPDPQAGDYLTCAVGCGLGCEGGLGCKALPCCRAMPVMPVCLD
jgi:hypothetical protein